MSIYLDNYSNHWIIKFNIIQILFNSTNEWIFINSFLLEINDDSHAQILIIMFRIFISIDIVFYCAKLFSSFNYYNFHFKLFFDINDYNGLLWIINGFEDIWEDQFKRINYWHSIKEIKLLRA